MTKKASTMADRAMDKTDITSAMSDILAMDMSKKASDMADIAMDKTDITSAMSDIAMDVTKKANDMAYIAMNKTDITSNLSDIAMLWLTGHLIEQKVFTRCCMVYILFSPRSVSLFLTLLAMFGM